MTVLILISIVAILFINFYLFKGTFFEFSLRRKSYFGILFAREIYIFILPGAVIFSLYFDLVSKTFYVDDESIRIATYYIFYSLIMFLLTLLALTKLFGKHIRPGESWFFVTMQDYRILKRFLFVLVFILLASYFLMALFGVKHAFVSSILFGSDLMSIRLSNSNVSMPSVLASFFKFTIMIYAIVLGLVFNKIRKSSKYFFIFLLLFFSSYHGSKAPVLYAVFLFLMASIHYRIFNLNIKFLIALVISFSITLVAIFNLVKVQYPYLDLNSFSTYLLNRIFIAQIHGVYEQFGLFLHKFEYIYSSLPFGQMFTSEFVLFSKDLNLATLSKGVASNETGVMNSLFIGEALAIGGYTLVFFSPLIVAINYFSIILITHFILKNILNLSNFTSRYFLQIFIPSYVVLTADFGGIFLFKLFFMCAIFLFACVVAYHVYTFLILKKYSYKR